MLLLQDLFLEQRIPRGYYSYFLQPLELIKIQEDTVVQTGLWEIYLNRLNMSKLVEIEALYFGEEGITRQTQIFSHTPTGVVQSLVLI